MGTVMNRKMLLTKIQHINAVTGSNFDLWKNGSRYRAYDGADRESPLLPAGQLWDWLDAFEKGFFFEPA